MRRRLLALCAVVLLLAGCVSSTRVEVNYPAPVAQSPSSTQIATLPGTTSDICVDELEGDDPDLSAATLDLDGDVLVLDLETTEPIRLSAQVPANSVGSGHHQKAVSLIVSSLLVTLWIARTQGEIKWYITYSTNGPSFMVDKAKLENDGDRWIINLPLDHPKITVPDVSVRWSVTVLGDDCPGDFGEDLVTDIFVKP